MTPLAVASTVLALIGAGQAVAIIYLVVRDTRRSEAWRRGQNAAIEYALRINIWSARIFLRLFADGEVHTIEREFPDFQQFRATYEAQEGY